MVKPKHILHSILLCGLSLSMLASVGAVKPNHTKASHFSYRQINRVYQHYHHGYSHYHRRNHWFHHWHKHVYYDGNVVNNTDYGFQGNYFKDLRTVRPYNYYHSIAGNENVKFGHPMYLHYMKHTKYNYGDAHGDPQSMVILPNGKLYVLFNAGHGDSPLNRIFEYNIKNRHFIKAGTDFYGGHGQGLSYNYQTHELWACINHYRHRGYKRGILPGDLILTRINQNSLQPYGKHVHISSRDALGENFSFDNSGDIWNVARSYSNREYSPYHSLRIYHSHNGKLKLVKDILHSPTSCIQNLTYNPETNRLYIVGNGVLTSIPANKINHLHNRDIHVAILNHHSEFEGMGFYNHKTYLLVHPNRILESNSIF